MLFSKKAVTFNSLIRPSVVIVLLMLLVPFSIKAESLGFRSVFGSNMVLPHSRPITLSGYASPNTALMLEADGKRYSFNSDADGQWQTQIMSLPAGGPYRIRLHDDTGAEIILENVLAGNVWLCSGQSNMAFPVAASIDQPDSYNLGHPWIRLFSVPLRAEISPLEEFVDPTSWQIATTDTVNPFSAVCYFFARETIDQDGIPLGLINASWGGSAIEAWISEQGFNGIAEYDHEVNQLRQYRGDRREAELSFANDWMQWWLASSDQGAVWEKGVLDTGPAWRETPWREAPLQNWKTYPDERLTNHHGIVWFSRSFELTSEQRKKGVTFVLGEIDEVDSTWINGEFINNSFGYGTRREYPLESGVLQEGINQITVNVLNTWGAGGMLGPAEEIGLRFDDGEFLPLGTDWYYRFITRETGYPPRAPWESVSGITGMFNGMISPLKALQPEGVIWYQGESNTESGSTYQSLLTALVSDWRRHFKGEFPFVFVQLPNYGETATGSVQSGWATIRNAQQQVALQDDSVGLVVTHDVGNDEDIHPRKKWLVGVRAARVAQALHGGGVADGVIPTVANMDSGIAVLNFSPPLQPSEGEKVVAGFSLCSDSGESCVLTSALQIGSRIKVSLNLFPDAGKLRYCWSDGGQCALKAMNGLPVSSFELELVGD